jgi:hypothetical protein
LTTFFKIYLIIKFLPDGNSAPNIELAEGIWGDAPKLNPPEATDEF